MLIKCPECELQLSDKALMCPHCGLPMKADLATKLVRKSNRKRRLPNGFGQISEIKGRNLRKPFRAMVTIGKSETGRPICKPLKPNAFFETYNEAYQALMEYHKSPFDIEKDLTVEQLYEKWSERHFKTLNEKSTVPIKSAWKYCSMLYNVKVRDLRARHLKECIENGEAVSEDGTKRKPTANMKSRIKSTFNSMLDYAVEYELTDKNYARDFKLDHEVIQEISKTQKSHIPYTDEEIEKIWKHKDEYQYADVVLTQCYSGWRPQEILSIKLEDVDLENWTFTGGMKTKAGIDRVVPIHKKVRPLVENAYNESKAVGSEYLFCLIKASKPRAVSYQTYIAYLKQIVEGLGLNPDHRAHDGRTHFVTQAKKYNVDEYAIKYIVGHSINDITEKVYTKRDVKWLEEEIHKIE